MNIAIIGSGGREAALAWKCRQSPQVTQVFVLPGNSAIEGSQPQINPLDFPALLDFCRTQAIEGLIVGSEQSLVEGIRDFFEGTGIWVFGPSAQAAQLEGSKQFAKAFMQRHGVRTAACHACQSLQEGQALIAEYQGRMVFKYDGLAAGKGVFVCHNAQEAQAALAALAEQYGANFPYLVEELLLGDEVSIMGLLDGQHFAALLPSQDHKQLLDNDQGPNTGGMGAFGPLPWMDEALHVAIQQDIIEPTLQGLQAEGFDYRGFLYFGIMVTAKGPYLLEYNVRLGDPETQALLCALDDELLPWILRCLAGELGQNQVLPQKPGYVLNLVLAAEGYPQAPKKGMLVEGLANLPQDLRFFPAGLSLNAQGQYQVQGGRVLSLVGQGEDLAELRERIYAAAAQIHFQGKQFRTDIGKRKWQYPFA